MRIKYSIFFFSIMLLFLAFDLRAMEGDSKVFIILRAILSLLFGFFALRKIKFNSNCSNLIMMTIIFSVHIFLVGLIRGQDTFQLFSLTMPYIFFFLGLVIVSSSLRDIINLDNLINIVLIFAIISVIYRVSFILIYSGVSLENARYSIISPALILLFSYGVTSLLFGYRKNWFIPFAISFFITLLSVTRTYLLVYLSIFIFAIFVLRFRSVQKNIGLPATLASVSVIFLFGSLSIASSFLDIWSNRLAFNDGGVLSDPTFLTRVAEMTFQIRILLESNINMIFGMGAAAETRFASEFYDLLSLVFSQNYEYVGAGVGHNNFVGLIYTGGFIMGSLFIFFQLTTMWKSFLYLRFKFKDISQKRSEHFIALWGAFSTIGFFCYGMFGGTFGDRLASLSFGVAFGLMFLGIFKLQNIKKL